MKELHEQIVLLLSRGASFDEMLRQLLQYKNRGVSQSQTYEVLEKIWREKGGGQAATENDLGLEMLEGLMDRVWGYCSAKDALWETSLSDAANQ